MIAPARNDRARDGTGTCGEGYTTNALIVDVRGNAGNEKLSEKASSESVKSWVLIFKAFLFRTGFSQAGTGGAEGGIRKGRDERGKLDGCPNVTRIWSPVPLGTGSSVPEPTPERSLTDFPLRRQKPDRGVLEKGIKRRREHSRNVEIIDWCLLQSIRCQSLLFIGRPILGEEAKGREREKSSLTWPRAALLGGGRYVPTGKREWSRMAGPVEDHLPTDGTRAVPAGVPSDCPDGNAPGSAIAEGGTRVVPAITRTYSRQQRQYGIPEIQQHVPRTAKDETRPRMFST